ncbi:dnaJ homolog subfamily C member 17-like [Triticum dicoccoides]|uniref:dnaJ homolog subfamily C member 17-like n=1 Tax=Triticum dicoccoides TaxID=85692 RepID=UPI00188E9F8D|nr:dnaJ homolog subfamily C member 17-like [Triticum dicoccoides]
MAAVADVDHYEVLRLPSGEEGEALSVEQIDKAYRAQSRLRHPDKRPDDPAATADFQGLVTSYRLLRDESLRRQFDARLRARRGAAARAAATGVKRRRAVSDLEERERAFAARAGAGPAFDPAQLARREDKRKAADVKRELEDFFRKSVASGSASTSAHGDNKGGTPDNRTKTDKGKVLKVSWEGGADYYTAAKLDEIFRQFGEVEDIVIKTRKSRSKGSAIVVMASKVAAQTALKNHSVYNVFLVPLMVAPIEELVGSPAFAAPTSEPRASNVDGTGFSDMEASVFRKLQEAQKRKQCA